MALAVSLKRIVQSSLESVQRVRLSCDRNKLDSTHHIPFKHYWPLTNKPIFKTILWKLSLVDRCFLRNEVQGNLRIIYCTMSHSGITNLQNLRFVPIPPRFYTFSPFHYLRFFRLATSKKVALIKTIKQARGMWRGEGVSGSPGSWKGPP